MCHEVVAMDFLEASILVAEVASFSIWAELLTVELPAILGFILVIKPCLGFGDSVDFGKFFGTMRVLALETISAEADFCPVLAHFALILFGLGQRNHLPILHKRHWRRFCVKCGGSSSVELPLLTHEGRLSGWNES